MFQKLKEIKKQLLYYLEHIQSRIIESNSFNVLKEKYQSRSLFHQKMIKYGSLSLIIFLVSFIPLYYFHLSSEHWSEFKEKRELSLDLLKVRNHKSIFSNVSEFRLRQDITNIIKKYKEKGYLIKDKPIPSKEKNLKKVVYEVKVDHLNIRQAVQMGMELNDILPAHLSSLIMKESDLYPKHYDVSFELSVYFHKIKKLRRSSRIEVNGGKKKKPLKRNQRGEVKSNKDITDKSFKPKFDKDIPKPSKFEFDKKPPSKKSLNKDVPNKKSPIDLNKESLKFKNDKNTKIESEKNIIQKSRKEM